DACIDPAFGRRVCSWTAAFMVARRGTGRDSAAQPCTERARLRSVGARVKYAPLGSATLRVSGCTRIAPFVAEPGDYRIWLVCWLGNGLLRSDLRCPTLERID